MKARRPLTVKRLSAVMMTGTVLMAAMMLMALSVSLSLPAVAAPSSGTKTAVATVPAATVPTATVSTTTVPAERDSSAGSPQQEKQQATQPADKPPATPPSAATVAAQPVAAPGPVPGTTLSLLENHLLSQDISAWAKGQGMRLLWNSRHDYLIYSTIRLHGKNRDEVLDQLGQLFRSENYGLVIRLYEKNNVLIIDGQ